MTDEEWLKAGYEKHTPWPGGRGWLKTISPDLLDKAPAVLVTSDEGSLPCVVGPFVIGVFHETSVRPKHTVTVACCFDKPSLAAILKAVLSAVESELIQLADERQRSRQNA